MDVPACDGSPSVESQIKNGWHLPHSQWNGLDWVFLFNYVESWTIIHNGSNNWLLGYLIVKVPFAELNLDMWVYMDPLHSAFSVLPDSYLGYLWKHSSFSVWTTGIEKLHGLTRGKSFPRWIFSIYKTRMSYSFTMGKLSSSWHCWRSICKQEILDSMVLIW